MLRTRKELIEKYNCSRVTLRKYMKLAGIPNYTLVTEGQYRALERVMNAMPSPSGDQSHDNNGISPMAFVGQ